MELALDYIHDMLIIPPDYDYQMDRDDDIQGAALLLDVPGSIEICLQDYMESDSNPEDSILLSILQKKITNQGKF